MRNVVWMSLMLLLWSCSDDNGHLQDGGVADSSVNDRAIEDQWFVPDSELPDHGTAADLKPDVDPGIPSDWTEEVVGTSNELNDVLGLAPNKVFAVGKDGLILGYDGSGWTAMVNPDPDKNSLYGLWEGSTNLYAVGESADLYYDGSAWFQGYTSSYSSYNFRDAWGSGGVLFAVGDMGGTIYSRDESDPSGYWSSVWFDDVSGAMYGIWGGSDGTLFVVGEGGMILTCASDCSGYDAAGWVEMSSPTSSHLQAVWGSSSSDIFAVGFDGTILHYDGNAWTKMSVNTTSYLYGVWGSSASDVYAVGHPLFAGDESIFHYDGVSWKKMPPPHTTKLNAVWGSSASDVWAVGKTHILHYDGT